MQLRKLVAQQYAEVVEAANLFDDKSDALGHAAVRARLLSDADMAPAEVAAGIRTLHEAARVSRLYQQRQYAASQLVEARTGAPAKRPSLATAPAQAAPAGPSVGSSGVGFRVQGV